MIIIIRIFDTETSRRASQRTTNWGSRRPSRKAAPSQNKQSTLSLDRERGNEDKRIVSNVILSRRLPKGFTRFKIVSKADDDDEWPFRYLCLISTSLEKSKEEENKKTKR